MYHILQEMVQVVALCGRKQSGKDSAAVFFMGRGYVHAKISAHLKQVCRELFGLSDEQVSGTEIQKESVDERYSMSPRYLMQFFGTEIMLGEAFKYIPSIGKDFWIKRCIHDISKHDCVVLSDLRFKHEYDSLFEVYGKDLTVIQVLRDSVKCVDPHSSENEFSLFPKHHVVINNGTLLELHQCLAKSTQIDEKTFEQCTCDLSLIKTQL